MTKASSIPPLSIIIPIYNGAKYFPRLTQNLYNLKGFKKFQIIFVNDGSTDKTKFLLIDFQKIHPNCTIATIAKNSGPSHARNIGLRHAKGRYVTFLDADDDFSPTIYQDLLRYANEHHLDACVCNYQELLNGEVIPSKYHYQTETLDQHTTIKRYLLDQISNSLCDKIFRLSLAKKIRFNENLTIGEDILFCLQFFQNTLKFGTLENTYYTYIQNPDSIMHRKLARFLEYQNVIPALTKKSKNDLDRNHQKEFAFFKTEMLTRTIHALSMSGTKSKHSTIIKYLNKVATKKNLNLIINNPYTPKTIRFEMKILKTFGPNFHLKIFPFYKKARKKIRNGKDKK